MCLLDLGIIFARILKKLNMKRLSLLLVLFATVGLASLSAQTCSKSTSASACCKKSGSVATTDKATENAAAKLASLDESIEARKCEKSGCITYVRKETDATGQVVFTSVEYDSKLGKFVNQSPSQMKSCGTGTKTAGCCSKSKGKATSADAGNSAAKQSTQKGS
jgi:hypothetical protein